MTQNELPPEVLSLIHLSVPTIDALEILVAMACNPGRSWTPDGIAAAVRPVPVPVLRQYLGQLKSEGIVSGDEAEGYRYQPATAAVGAAVTGLCQAYNQRPVTLIRAVYASADRRNIQSFADAFRLRRDER